MSNKSESEAIEARLREIAEKKALLEREEEELELALRVIKRFSPSNGVAPKLGPARPEGGPTLFEMTETVLAQAEAKGKPGLKGREIVAEIGRQFWPGVKPAQVLPQVYGYAKKDRLKKTAAGLFKRVPKNEAPTE
jgi:hypothetical protein